MLSEKNRKIIDTFPEERRRWFWQAYNEQGEVNMNPIYKYILVLAGAGFAVWYTVVEFPPVKAMVTRHEIRLAIIETQYAAIKEDTTEIKRLLREKRNGRNNGD
jgi:hypothetical protein